MAQEAGDPSIPAFLGGVVAATVGGEVASSPLISAFDGAGQNRAVAGAQQVGTGTALGSVLSAIMPVSGVMTTLVEKFQADTIGLARTEQIGLFKNTMVGAVRNTTIGQKEFTKVGVEQRLQVGKIKTVDVGEEYTTHTGQRAAHSSGKLSRYPRPRSSRAARRSGRSGPTTRCCCRHPAAMSRSTGPACASAD